MVDFFFNHQSGRGPEFVGPGPNANNPDSNQQQVGQAQAPPQAQAQSTGSGSSSAPPSPSASVSVPFPETATANPTRTTGAGENPVILGAPLTNPGAVTVNMNILEHSMNHGNTNTMDSSHSNLDSQDKPLMDFGSSSTRTSSASHTASFGNANAPEPTGDVTMETNEPKEESESAPNDNGTSNTGQEKVSAAQAALRAVQQFRDITYSAKPPPSPAATATAAKPESEAAFATAGSNGLQESPDNDHGAETMEVDEPMNNDDNAQGPGSEKYFSASSNDFDNDAKKPSSFGATSGDGAADPFQNANFNPMGGFHNRGDPNNDQKKEANPMSSGGMQPSFMNNMKAPAGPPPSPTANNNGNNGSTSAVGNAGEPNMGGNGNGNNPYMPVPPPNPTPMQNAQSMNPIGRPMQDPPAFVAMRELKVEDALNYLDQVKLEFGDRPRIYNEFLEIMKNFKAHEIDTPGVIMRVSDLFRGYNNLILGFNTFLPDGFKISIKDLVEGGRYASKKPIPQNAPGAQGGNVPIMAIQQMPPMAQMGGGQQTPLGHAVNAARPNPTHISEMQSMQGNRDGWGNFPSSGGGDMAQRQVQNQGMQGHEPAQMQSGHQAPMLQPQKPPMTDQQQQEQQENPAIEFDHAITYVTTIKKRFGNEPRTYQQFLEILHTYQKEQRGIREVLEQVSSLFADHPDLLKQFTYFLPEAVQEQAKERLHAAAAEAEARQAAARKRAAEASNHYAAQNKTEPRGEGQEISFDLTQKQQVGGSEARPMQTSPGSKKRPSSPSNVTMQYPMMPETMVYNAGVERQFFDMAKEALRSSSRDGELAWAEFLKCMDLYAQEILSKNDMLRYMEDLLGKQHADLFEEFKRILASAGAAGAQSHDDAWHSVPLSEIDFSRCRRCTPSYRALPRDYPVAPFSGRSEEEAKLLNDVWISLPDGSEESYTFRHMRKNHHEEVLFRCEDERFEIDMVIDSTATALNRLEPIADEIAMLQQKEMFSRKVAGSDAKEKSGIKAALEAGGMAGKTVKYSFDKSILNTIHRHAIARIYGDAGQEMLDLMEKNPVVAIPVVVKRLKQKDRDFRAARDVLNRRWKELAEINYYKSIDHRSLTWRTIDKRATSTRTLAAEIKDRAAHSGLESEATFVAKRDKAKEEFGSFYEKTMGRYLERKMDLTHLPRPAPSTFTPHYSMRYDSNSWAQRDAYRILSFALERGSISPGDKERCHRVWTDFLAPFFELSSIWMQSPAVAYAALPHHHTPSIVSNGDESGNDDDESSADENEMVGDMMVTEEVMKDCNNTDTESMTGFNLLNNQPIPSGASVSTIYGDGAVIKFRSSDKSYLVSLPFGATAYLNCNAVLCTILPVDQYLGLDQPVISDEAPLDRKDDRIMLGPQSLYLFFRLHQVLIRRLNIARNLAFAVDKDQSLCTLIEHITPDGNSSVGQKRYDAYLSLVYGLLEGGYNSTFQGGSANAAEGGKYEDRVRCLLGHGAYELATMDKLVAHILKHLQNLANDDTMQGMIQIFKKQMDSGCFKPQAFKQEAAMISEGENTFAFQYCHIPKSDNTIMHVEFLGCITDKDDDDSMASATEAHDGPAAKKLKK